MFFAVLSPLSSPAFATDPEEAHHVAPTHDLIVIGGDAGMSAPEVEAEATLHSHLTVPLGEHLGLSFAGRATTREFYGEAYVGLAFGIGHFILTPSFGVETSELPIRGALSGDFLTERLQLFGVAEFGGSGAWYQGFALVALHEHVSAGLYGARYYGAGPRVDLELHDHFDLWAAAVVNPVNPWAGEVRGGGVAGFNVGY